MSMELSEATTMVEQAATGAARAARKATVRPVAEARRRVKGLERQSARTVRQINRRFGARIRSIYPERIDVWGIELNNQFPERAAVKGLHLVKAQARRRDRTGDMAKATLHALHTTFGTIARVATRFEQASDLSTKPSTARVKRTTRRPVARRAA